MQWQLGKALRAGDEVAVVLPAGGIRDQGAFAHGMARLRAWGLRPTVLPDGAEHHRLDWPEGSPLAATDDARLAALQRALAEPRFRAVFCGRGGYGTTRLLDALDWRPLAADPKPIVGYSDVTALLCGAAVGAHLVGFHGPMVATVAAMDPGQDGWRLQHRLLTEAGGSVELPPRRDALALVAGDATGPLVGGNLAVLQSLIGTPWSPPIDGALLFLEDIGEAPYRVDRMLTQLRQCGWFTRAAGILLGDFHVDGTELASAHAPMQQVLAERLADLDIPVACGLPFGHRPGAWTLPFGGRARLVATENSVHLTLLEPSVR